MPDLTKEQPRQIESAGVRYLTSVAGYSRMDKNGTQVLDKN
jgi:hypothetical protein